jgi:membrane protein YdbS with pleckstrin-like domain
MSDPSTDADATAPHADPSRATDTIADGVVRKLDPRWITVQRTRAIIASVVLSSASLTGTLILWLGSGRWVTGLVLLPLWAVLMTLLAWRLYTWPAIAYRLASYRVDQDGLEIQRGVYWRTITNVPRSRVQHTDVSQGPLERRHGLGTLVVYTAGTQHAEVKLPGLAFSVARGIRAHLLPDGDGDAV